MGKLRTGWNWLNHAFTAQALIKLILPLVGVGALAAYLAYLTTFLRLFAPVSYLLAALAAMALVALTLGAIAGLARQLGWSPKPPQRRLPARNAPLRKVVKYVGRDSAYAISTVTKETKVRDVALEIMDRVVEHRLTVWGRVGDFPIGPIKQNALESGALDLQGELLKRVTEWGTVEYKDVQFNWREVRQTWPRPPIWSRIAARWKGEPKNVLTAC